MKSFARLFVVVLCTAALVAGCSGGSALSRLDGVPSIHAPAISWLSPAAEPDRASLKNWREAVGAPFINIAAGRDSATAELDIVSWNTAVGDGDIVKFVTRVRNGRPMVLLLQEVYRRGAAVPRLPGPQWRFAGRLGTRGAAKTDIETAAASLGMSVYYVPSMRNGGPDSDEDRGNAILSDLPLSDLTAIELPFERQRRVALAATITGHTASGQPWHLRVANVHLDNAMPARAWIGSEYGRARQARGLVAALGNAEPVVLGGDFNTWFGFSDQVFVETIRAFPQTVTTDRRATFRGLLRLDHLFYRLPAGWRGDLHRADDRFGSDHAPLIGTLHITAHE
jgi:endonuclease/exonuclease/phosphatase family metal-dependent hydrolase